MGYNPKLATDDFPPRRLAYTLRGGRHRGAKDDLLSSYQWDNDELCQLWDEELEIIDRAIDRLLEISAHEYDPDEKDREINTFKILYPMLLGLSKGELNLAKALIEKVIDARKRDDENGEIFALKDVLRVGHHRWPRRNSAHASVWHSFGYLLGYMEQVTSPGEVERKKRTVGIFRQHFAERRQKRGKRAPQFGRRAPPLHQHPTAKTAKPDEKRI